MITLEQAKALRPGDMVHHVLNKNSDGTPERWKVNGRPKIWSTRPDEVRVPIKYGLKTCDYITEQNLDLVNLGDGRGA